MVNEALVYRIENVAGYVSEKVNSVLKSVSRSLYLTFRLLPIAQRASISYAFLLAKIGDTIVDSYNENLSNRMEAFIEFRKLLSNLFEKQSSEVNYLSFLIKTVSASEKNLLVQVGNIADLYRYLSDDEQSLVSDVVRSISDKQFEELKSLVEVGEYRLSSLDDLNDYIYRMSGVVGDFWTKVGASLPNYSHLSTTELQDLGIQYGNSLHLLNIIRDIENDLSNQRFYYPVENVCSRAEYFNEARLLSKSIIAGLESGLIYARSLKNYSQRVAVGMPARLGLIFMSKIEEMDWEEFRTAQILTRKKVYRQLVLALISNLSFLK